MIPWKTIKAVLFDMDGVIADTRDAHRDAWVKFAEQENQPIDIEDFMLKSFGRGNNQVLALFYQDRPEDLEFYRVKGAEKEEIFLEIFRSGIVPPVKGLHAFVEELARQGIKMAVGSSAPRGNIDVVLETYRLHEYFPVIVSMHDVKHAKPDPEIFLKCAERLGVHASECIVLEDSIHGLEAGRAAGCFNVGFTTMHTAEEIEHLSDAIVPDFEPLTKEFLGQSN